MTHCAVSRLCCFLLKFRSRTSPFSGQDSVRRNMCSAVGRTRKKYHLSLASPLQWGQFTVVDIQCFIAFLEMLSL